MLFCVFGLGRKLSLYVDVGKSVLRLKESEDSCMSCVVLGCFARDKFLFLNRSICGSVGTLGVLSKKGGRAESRVERA